MMRSIGTRRARRVQGRKDEMTGFRRRNGGLHRFEVAHFPDEDHVRVLAEHPLESLAEGRHVHADLALVHDALLVGVISTRWGLQP